MAAGKTKGPVPPQNNNALLTGVVVFVLFLVGVWLFATPAHQPHVQAVVESTETESELAALEAAKAAKAADAAQVTSGSSQPSSGGNGAELSSESEVVEGAPSQASESQQEKEEQRKESQQQGQQQEQNPAGNQGSSSGVDAISFPLCTNVKDDHIPCLDNEKALKALTSTAHYEHRERHCPAQADKLKCLLPLPEGYKPRISWPESRDQIWFNNVPKPSLANYKADQHWVVAEGDKFVFPGGGTQFKFGATKYIEWVQDTCPELNWGKHVRVGLDMGCGVASFAAYLDPFDVRMMSVAPKDEHDAQIQFALERGISALVGVMGTQRQPYPANVYDAVHCARCRVPWHKDGGMLLLELNRLIRPGGYFVWSATPICLDCSAKEPDDKEVWEAMEVLTANMCWKMIVKVVNRDFGIGVAVYQKPTDNECFDNRAPDTVPPMCAEDDNPDAAWYVPMTACLHRVPTDPNQHGSKWPADGPARLTEAPQWLAGMEKGVYGRPALEEFKTDADHWEHVMKTYMKNLNIDWSTVRNVMDMDAHYGGFGAALAVTGIQAWSMNVVPTISPDTLAVVYDRGLLGIYHDWCESFNTYPRTYDLLHDDHLLGHIVQKGGCELEDVMIEIDRILRPMGYIILREKDATATKVQAFAAGFQWTELKVIKEGNEVLLAYQKTLWRPTA